MHKTVAIGKLKPNPWRKIKSYPIDREKVGALKNSIHRTGWWENVLGREVNGNIEIAYGHHRLVALRELFGPEKKVTLPIHKLDNATMIQIMAHENMEEWGHSATIGQETIRTVVEAYAAGEIKLKSPGGSKNQWRYAPSFIKGETVSGERPAIYSAISIKDFLGWEESKIQNILAQLELLERGGLSPRHFVGKGSRQAAELGTAVGKVINEGDSLLAKKQRVIETAEKRGRKGDAAKAREEKAFLEKQIKKEARETAAHLSGRIGTIKEGGGLATDDVQAEANKRRRKLHPEKRIRNIDDFCDRLAAKLGKILTPEGDKTNAENLQALIAEREFIKKGVRKNLIRVLRNLATRATKMADVVESQAKSRKLERI